MPESEPKPGNSKVDDDSALVEEIKVLKNRRSYMKRTFTTLDNYVKSYNNTPQSREQIRHQLFKCKEAVNKFEDDLENCYDCDLEDSFSEFFKDEELAGARFAALVVECNRLDIYLDDNVNANFPAMNSTISTANRDLGVRLPALQLPNFSGKIEEWMSFFEAFQRAVDSNNSLSAVEKFQYLKGALSNDASEVIKCLEITEDNYANAVQLLKDRYENKRILLNIHLRALFEAESVHKENHNGIRNILDTFLQHIRSLSAMKRPIEHWDDLLVYLLLSKLPLLIRKEFENTILYTDIPTFKQITEFLTQKCHTLTNLNIQEIEIKNKLPYRVNKYNCNLVTNEAHNKFYCHFCSRSEHYLSKCPQYLKLSIGDRSDFVKSKQLCMNCLRKGHFNKQCRSSRCFKCHGLHNTTLHVDKSIVAITTDIVNLDVEHNVEPSTSAVANSMLAETPATVLLSTCIVQVKNNKNEWIDVRALLDTGSQINVCTRKLAEKLGLNKQIASISIAGINSSHSNQINTTESMNIMVKSKQTNFSHNLNTYILDRICNNIPNISFNHINIPHNIRLADPTFCRSGEIELLIGNEIFYKIMCIGQIQVNRLVLQKSVFGWIVSGRLDEGIIKRADCLLVSLAECIENFWKIENVSDYCKSVCRSDEELFCENFFATTTVRNADNRFVCRLPFKMSTDKLGDSFNLARRRFLNLERKLLNDPVAKEGYDKFMKEYIDLGHMRLLGPADDSHIVEGYYIPHHAVYKLHSLTSKIRVVFNASAKTTSGFSLNDILARGPVIQSDLFSILLRFRYYLLVLSADISKMYRQILIALKDCKFQRIFYRFDNSRPLDIYELLTLTYGTKSASFIATRCLKALADIVRELNPRLAAIIEEEFYMDDFYTGGDDIKALILIRDAINALFQESGFELLQWVSNAPELVSGLECEAQNVKNLVIDCQENENVKALGLTWSPNNDIISFTYEPKISCTETKRSILSSISHLFDPLGLLGPVTVSAKLVMQDIWQLGLKWDESLPLEVHSRWAVIRDQLSNINTLKLPRGVIKSTNSKLELHCFADASEKAYGAAVYLKEVDSSGHINCSLITSKSRVAPLKKVSLPRLELCAALLLSELFSKVVENSKQNFSRFYFYTDSTICLAWINACPSRWHTFVANRVTKIQSLTDQKKWFHVKSEENPADIISRGSTPANLVNNSTWWHGPIFLQDLNFEPVEYKFSKEDDIPELKCLIAQPLCFDNDFCNSLLEKYSTFNKLVRVIAYCYRFYFNCKNPTKNINKYLLSEEINNAEFILIRLVQTQHFGTDINDLKSTGRVCNSSKILTLSPFLDSNDILRVGGRLKHSNLNYDSKHPILIPHSSPVTDLIIDMNHKNGLHIGEQGTLSMTRNRFWIVNGRTSVKKVLRKCVKCRVFNPIFSAPKMADLPESRSNIARPFARTGTDFCGPFFIKEGGRRSRKVCKVYVCIFVCFVVKAVHLEVVEDLTTESFMAAMSRFVSRRGLVREMYSDNGTNYVGASNELKLIYKFLETNEAELYESLALKKVEWHFNPPSAPHFGGLFEAAVKCFKKHFYKVAGDANLTLAEMITLVTEIEGILNSRPMTPISTDPNDMTCLTPAHFLIGANIFSLPEVDLLDVKMNTLSRWQRIQQIRQHFWRRWKTDYLQELQRRQKWFYPQGDALTIGRLVIIKDDNTPSRRWKMGRISAVHPGDDSQTRVVTVRTVNGEKLRPVTKLCVLPVEEEDGKKI